MSWDLAPFHMPSSRSWAKPVTLYSQTCRLFSRWVLPSVWLRKKKKLRLSLLPSHFSLCTLLSVRWSPSTVEQKTCWKVQLRLLSASHLFRWVYSAVSSSDSVFLRCTTVSTKSNCHRYYRSSVEQDSYQLSLRLYIPALVSWCSLSGQSSRQGSTHLEILYLIQAMQEHGYMVSSKDYYFHSVFITYSTFHSGRLHLVEQWKSAALSSKVHRTSSLHSSLTRQ